MENLVLWFYREKGSLDTASIGLADIPGQGRGAIALQDIPEGHALFTIPRSLTLSTRTSSLPALIGTASWRRLRLDKGWVGLILCMMWEQSLGDKSKWSGYLKSLPNRFDTPMFWSADDLKELVGTDVIDKIGKDEAERDYRERLYPTLQSRPDVFSPFHLSTIYSLENYHLMGSRILSRSFHVERWEDEEKEGYEEKPDENHGAPDDKMDVDDEGQDSDEEDNDEQDSSDVAMVPMADMLNARYGSENAKLFYEPTELKMVTTKPIKAGEQIYNTYGDLPNSELLRRYGHVDLIPLAGESNTRTLVEGNPADVVEVPADLAVKVVSSYLHKTVDDNELKERIDWWLDEGGDDVFVLETSCALPDSLTSFIKLLLDSTPEWEKARDKGKPPKPKMDAQMLPLVLTLLRDRLERYPTSLENDESLLASSPEPLSSNKRNAVIVRIGEKRILKGSISRLEALRKELVGDDGTKGRDRDGTQRKRKR